ncbi:unnamed protein product [Sphenostylis stenocarpa]|uniref:URB1 N-terminal domain-containing protein n=1 Tax=Sphenostylis stenocarpa TaxID=92480 RepID=A0AA86RT07_9FABA|nr:unnamed protein product [Sphenostylis stenocarpa]
MEKVVHDIQYCWCGVAQGKPAGHEAMDIHSLRVLVVESLVPLGLRSVLFGSATLEQLVEFCGREGGGDAAEVAFGVLVRVCTDPCNGLMPDSKMRLRGNTKRVLDLMKKLRVTEVQYHRDLFFCYC